MRRATWHDHAMRAACLLVALVACTKAEPPPPKVTPAPSPPVERPIVAPADASPAAAPIPHVDLLRAVPSTVRVSSTVKNKAIVPAHLVDKDLKTAWNSATGELVGAWIDVDVAAGSVIRELRMTSGFTATGPKGDDYFTMNPRIQQLRVIADGTPAVTLDLAVARRDLQTFAVTATTQLRIEITKIVPGSKKTWREASMSELEVWGTPPPGWKAPARPLVPSVEVGAVVAAADAEDPCATTTEQREAFIEQHKNDVHEGNGAEDHAYPPDCGDFEIGPVHQLPAPWTDAKSWCVINDEIYGPKECFLRFTHAGAAATLTAEHTASRAEISAALSLRDAIPGGEEELVVRIKTPDGESLAICRSTPLACTAQIVVASDQWTVRESFAKGMLVLAKGTGAPPAGVIGSHPLAFQ